MKIKMLNTVKLVGFPRCQYFKGRTYNATLASNQPDCGTKDAPKKVFAFKKIDFSSMLIERLDFEVVK